MSDDKMRKQDLKVIHTGKRALGMEEDSYREMLRRVTGKSSSAEMTPNERWKVIQELRRLGFGEGDKRHRKPRQPQIDRSQSFGAEGMLRKVEALLAEQKLAWGYADGIAKQMYKVESVRWLNEAQLTGVITALVKRGQKQAAQAATQAEEVQA